MQFQSEEGMDDDSVVVLVDEGEPSKRSPGFGATIDPADDANRERLNKLLQQTKHNPSR